MRMLSQIKTSLLLILLVISCVKVDYLELDPKNPKSYALSFLADLMRKSSSTISTQEASLQIQGVLKDSSGNPIPYATLTLGTAQNTISKESITTSTTTDANGNYTLNMSLGTFSVRVTNSSGVELGTFQLKASSTSTKPEIESTSGNLNVVVNAVAPPSPIAPIVPTSPSASPPSELSYSTGTLNLTVGTPMSPLTPTVKGIVSIYSISPNLPAGLSLNPISGVLSGTPVFSISSTKYNIKASNSTGSVPFEIYLSVTLLKPSNFSYQSTSYNFVVGNLITSISPSINGTVEAYSISPILDNGLVFSSSSGIISGTPNLAQSSKEYTLTASNSGGSVTFKLSIVILPIAPSNLSYQSNSITVKLGTPLSPLIPSINGDATTYSINPTFNNGLNFNATTGIISGTPTFTQSIKNYIITASNSGGSTNFTISILILPIAPSNLRYQSSNLTLTIGSVINNLNPSVDGSVSSYSINPSLTNGLIFNTSTGIISGTPTSTQSLTNYTITASNSGGSTTYNINIEIFPIAPSNLSYQTNSLKLKIGTSISRLTPSVNGVINSYSISPEFNNGLIFNTTNGYIEGTPTTIQSPTNYKITATNSAGNVVYNLSVEINPLPPTNLKYESNSFTYIINNPINIITPSFSGIVDTYSISPVFNNGLKFNTTSGSISGTPTTLQGTTNYSVTASNSGGITTYTLSISILRYKDDNRKVIDGVTGLVWQKCSFNQTYSSDSAGNIFCLGSGSISTYYDAINNCDNLILGDNSNWRLPTITELETLIVQNYYPKIDNTFFPNTKTDKQYWSSTDSFSGSFSGVLGVYFHDGTTSGTGKTSYGYYRCVYKPQ
jgi:hypothetical protein